MKGTNTDIELQLLIWKAKLLGLFRHFLTFPGSMCHMGNHLVLQPVQSQTPVKPLAM